MLRVNAIALRSCEYGCGFKPQGETVEHNGGVVASWHHVLRMTRCWHLTGAPVRVWATVNRPFPLNYVRGRDPSAMAWRVQSKCFAVL